MHSSRSDSANVPSKYEEENARKGPRDSQRGVRKNGMHPEKLLFDLYRVRLKPTQTHTHPKVFSVYVVYWNVFFSNLHSFPTLHYLCAIKCIEMVNYTTENSNSFYGKNVLFDTQIDVSRLVFVSKPIVIKNRTWQWTKTSIDSVFIRRKLLWLYDRNHYFKQFLVYFDGYKWNLFF